MVIKGDPIKMLKAIQEHTMSYQENWYDTNIVVDAIRNMISPSRGMMKTSGTTQGY
jgi:hypothetical protein